MLPPSFGKSKHRLRTHAPAFKEISPYTLNVVGKFAGAEFAHVYHGLPGCS